MLIMLLIHLPSVEAHSLPNHRMKSFLHVYIRVIRPTNIAKIKEPMS